MAYEEFLREHQDALRSVKGEVQVPPLSRTEAGGSVSSLARAESME